MISNIFGLHLGCMVKCKGWKKTGFVFRILPDYEDVSKWEIGVIFWNKNKTWSEIHDIPISDCKLLLKPLSAMSDEDKREFEKEFGCEEKVIRFEIYNEKTVLVCFEFTDFEGDPMDRWDDMSLNEMLWLCSKGYDVGIVPDEYKESINGKD